MDKCPGSREPRNLDSVLINCQNCGRQVEIFTDEPKRRCRCGQLLFRESLPRCAEWCPAADRCFGKVIDARELERRLGRGKKNAIAGQLKERMKDRRKEQKGNGHS